MRTTLWYIRKKDVKVLKLLSSFSLQNLFNSFREIVLRVIIAHEFSWTSS